MARHIGASQAHVSRVESGYAVPTLPQVRAWAAAAAVPEDARPALVALTEAALNEFDSWQDRDGTPPPGSNGTSQDPGRRKRP